jgi:hypothetical protein
MDPVSPGNPVNDFCPQSRRFADVSHGDADDGEGIGGLFRGSNPGAASSRHDQQCNRNGTVGEAKDASSPDGKRKQGVHWCPFI